MDNHSKEVDDILRELGQQWRATAPSSIAVSERWFTRRSRPARNLLPNAIAFALIAAVAVLALPRVLPDLAGSGEPTPSASGAGTRATPTATSSPSPTPAAFDIVKDGQRITANAFVLDADDGGLKVCDLALARAEPGAEGFCIGPEIEIDAADSYRSLIGYNANITGTWRDGRIIVESASVAPIDETASRGDVPCVEPAGGWPSLSGDIVEIEEAIGRLVDYVEARPRDFAGTWSVRMAGRQAGVLVVPTTLERAAAERELRAVFPGALCVEPVEFGGEELADVAEQLRAMNRSWDVTIEAQLNRVAVVVAAIDQETADLLEPHREMIDVRPIVRPLPVASTPSPPREASSRAHQCEPAKSRRRSTGLQLVLTNPR